MRILLILALLTLSACAHKRVVMKNCEPANTPFWVCEEQ